MFNMPNDVESTTLRVCRQHIVAALVCVASGVAADALSVAIVAALCRCTCPIRVSVDDDGGFDGQVECAVCVCVLWRLHNCVYLYDVRRCIVSLACQTHLEVRERQRSSDSSRRIPTLVGAHALG